MPGCASTRTASNRSSLFHATTNPPSRLAAALSAWPSIPAVICSNASLSAATSRPASTAAAAAPATTAAAELPRPRACGIALRQRRCSPERRVAEHRERATQGTDDEVPLVAGHAGARPRRPRPSGRPAATATSTSSYSASASPSESNPGPRFADDAGTRTRTSSGLPTAALHIRRARAPGSGRHRSSSASATAPGSIGTHRRLGRGEQRRVRVLEAVPGHRAHHQRPLRQRRVLRRLQQPRHARRRRRLDEHRLARREQPVRREDLVVRHRREPAVRLVTRRDRLRPRRGRADPDRGRDRLGVPHRRAVHQRGRARGLEAEHPRQRVDHPVLARTRGSPPSTR